MEEKSVAAFNRLCKEQDDIYKNYALRCGISDTVMWIMYALCASEEPCSQYDLSMSWFYSRQTINSAINKLIKDGYVYLSSAEGNRKRKIVTLTDSGKAFCRQHIEPLLKAENEVFDCFSREETELFLALWKKYIKRLKANAEKIN